MRISIAERLRPYSHLPGSKLLLPLAGTRVQVFPALLKIEGEDFPLSLSGPVKNFTVQQDLERPSIRVFGEAREGYFRYRLEDGNCIIERDPGKVLAGLPKTFSNKKTELPFLDKLSLGSHKSQDWELIRRRLDLKEILPLIMRLGQLLPIATASTSGTGKLLEDLKTAEKDLLYDKLCGFFLAGFSSLLYPRLNDSEHQGIAPSSDEGDASFLLSHGAEFIRSLFLRERTTEIAILPSLLPEFHAGRLLGEHVDMEWSKKRIRRLVYRSGETPKSLVFKKSKSCRLRTSLKDRGQTIDCTGPLQLTPSGTFYLDRFTH